VRSPASVSAASDLRAGVGGDAAAVRDDDRSAE
jgi:hypothetical protein